MSEKHAFISLAQKFLEQDMDKAASIIESLTEDEGAEIINSLPPLLAVRLIKHFQVSYAAALLKNVDENFLREITAHLEPQVATSILMHLPGDVRERMTTQLTGKLKGQIRELLEYPEDSIGRIMTTDFLTFNKDILAEDAIDKIRSMAKKRLPLSYIYVIDDEKHLIGVLNMRDLMIAAPDKPLEAIMLKDVFSLHCFVDKQAAANELAKRKFFAAPVVDSENYILGIIKAERMLQKVQDDITKDIQRMVGVGANERVFSNISYSLKKRLPWLHINLATAFLAAAVVAMFEGIIAKLTILAVFLPVVAGQGGNAGAQSLAVVMRGIVMREIPKNKIFSLIIKEAKLGTINGAIIGAVTALVAWIWYGNPYLGVVIGLGMLVNLIFAGFFGASIPLLMQKVGIDPAQSSSIILTTMTDVLGFSSLFLDLRFYFKIC